MRRNQKLVTLRGGQRVDWHNFWKIKCNAKINSNQLKSQKKLDMWMVFFGETFIILYRRAGAGKINLNSYWQLTRRDHFLLVVGLGPRQNFQFPMKPKPQALRFHPFMLYCWSAMSKALCIQREYQRLYTSSLILKYFNFICISIPSSKILPSFLSFLISLQILDHLVWYLDISGHLLKWFGPWPQYWS